jgi:hypothetical protein
MFAFCSYIFRSHQQLLNPTDVLKMCLNTITYATALENSEEKRPLTGNSRSLGGRDTVSRNHAMCNCDRIACVA